MEAPSALWRYVLTDCFPVSSKRLSIPAHERIDTTCVGGDDGTIVLTALDTGDEVARYSHAHYSPILTLICDLPSMHGISFISGAADGTVQLWDQRLRPVEDRLYLHKGGVISIVRVANHFTSTAEGTIHYLQKIYLTKADPRHLIRWIYRNVGFLGRWSGHKFSARRAEGGNTTANGPHTTRPCQRR